MDSQMPPGNQAFTTGPWRTWFAWRPVRLFGSSRVIWCRQIYRRTVRCDFRRGMTDYSDNPRRYPSGPSDPARWLSQK